MVWYGEGVWPTCICDWSESLQRRFGRRRRGMGSGFVGANMGLGFGWWRRALAVGSILDDGECFGWRRRFDREACIGWQRSGMGKKKANRRNRKLEFSFLYYWIFFLNNADVENCGSFKGFNFIYIYIYHILYIIAEAERKWVPTIKEVVTNRKKDLFKNWHVHNFNLKHSHSTTFCLSELCHACN